MWLKNIKSKDANTMGEAAAAADDNFDFAAINRNPRVIVNLMGSPVIGRCSICMRQIMKATTSDQPFGLWPVSPSVCNHLFHQDCLANWIWSCKPDDVEVDEELGYFVATWETRCPYCNRLFRHYCFPVS